MLTIVKEHEKYGAVNTDTNKVIVPYVFDDIKIAHDCLLLKDGDKWGILTISELEKLTQKEFPLNSKNNYNDVIERLKTLFGDSNIVPYYLFFDTETTGVPRNYNAPVSDVNNWPRLVQLAWIACDANGNELASENFIIKPNGFTIPYEASSVHGITTEIAREQGVDLNYAIDRFIKLAENTSYLVGHNVSFDMNIVGAELIRLGNAFRMTSKQSICTMLKTTNYCAIQSGFTYGDRYKWPKLQELHKKLFGYEFEEAHDAMADIIATKKCFFELKNRGII